MAKRRNALQLGILTIAVGITFFAVLIWLSRQVGGEMKTVTIHFKPTPAMPTLSKGSVVLIGGQKVGQVIEASLDPPQAAQDGAAPGAMPVVVVRAEILKTIVLRTDCSAFAEGPPLGGDGLVKIDIGQADKPLAASAVIQGSEPGGFPALLASLQSEFNGDDPGSLLGQIKSQLDPEGERSLIAKLNQSLADINRMTAALADELTPSEKATLMAKIHTIVDNVNTTTLQLRNEFDTAKPDVLLYKVHLAMDALNGGFDAIVRILQAGEGPITRTLANVEKTSEQIAAETDAARADSLMAYFKSASVKINASLDDVNKMTDTTREVLVLNRGNINRMIANFKEASDYIKTGTQYVLLHPWLLFNEPKVSELKQQAIFDAARSFAEAATRIDDASAQLRALSELHEGAVPLDDPDLAKIRDNLNETREKYKKAEGELWRQLGLN